MKLLLSLSFPKSWLPDIDQRVPWSLNLPSVVTVTVGKTDVSSSSSWQYSGIFFSASRELLSRRLLFLSHSHSVFSNSNFFCSSLRTVFLGTIHISFLFCKWATLLFVCSFWRHAGESPQQHSVDERPRDGPRHASNIQNLPDPQSHIKPSTSAPPPHPPCVWLWQLV